MKQAFSSSFGELDFSSLSDLRLLVANSKQAIAQAKILLAQTKRNNSTNLSTEAIIEIVETIIVYKFPKLGREEIEQMLGLSELKSTRVYQEALQEGRQEGWQEGRQEGCQEGEKTGEVRLIFRLISKRFGAIPIDTETQIRSLSVAQLEALGEALLDFSSLSDLSAWLK